MMIFVLTSGCWAPWLTALIPILTSARLDLTLLLFLMGRPLAGHLLASHLCHGIDVRLGLAVEPTACLMVMHDHGGNPLIASMRRFSNTNRGQRSIPMAMGESVLDAAGTGLQTSGSMVCMTSILSGMGIWPQQLACVAHRRLPAMLPGAP